MKTFLTDEEKAFLREAVTPFDTPERRAKYLRGDFDRADKVKDLDKRYRWDLLWARQIPHEFFRTIYDRGGQDDHIDTALRQIVKPLKEDT